jgi:hypothetical protein
MSLFASPTLMTQTGIDPLCPITPAEFDGGGAPAVAEPPRPIAIEDAAAPAPWFAAPAGTGLIVTAGAAGAGGAAAGACCAHASDAASSDVLRNEIMCMIRDFEVRL